MAINLQTSFLTPPFGFALFYLKGVAPPEVATLSIYRGVIPFVIIQLIGLAIVIYEPEMALWLPRLIYIIVIKTASLDAVFFLKGFNMRKVGICGAGLIGASWAIGFANAGYKSLVYDNNPNSSENFKKIFDKLIQDIKLISPDIDAEKIPSFSLTYFVLDT